MITGTPEKAREFFATKMAFTTGPVDVKNMLDRKEKVTVIDVRHPDIYAKGHIPGAVNLPQGQWHTAKGASKDELNIIYCYSQACHMAAAAALELASQGYRVMEMEGGFSAWTASHFEVEGKDHPGSATGRDRTSEGGAA